MYIHQNVKNDTIYYKIVKTLKFYQASPQTDNRCRQCKQYCDLR